MTVFIICVGTRDPLWSDGRDSKCTKGVNYDPEELSEWEDQDEYSYDKTHNACYKKGPILMFFKYLLASRKGIFEKPVSIYLLGTKKISPFYSSTSLSLDNIGDQAQRLQNLSNEIKRVKDDFQPFSDKAVISFEAISGEWLISDTVRKYEYVVRKKENGLNIYEATVPPDTMTYNRGRQVANFLEKYVFNSSYNRKVFCYPIYVNNPADSSELYPVIRGRLEQIKAECQTDRSGRISYIINPQPGTPQMSYVLIALAVAGFFSPEPEFIEGIDPKYQQKGRTLMEDNISNISQNAILRRAGLFFRQGYFWSAREAFEDLSQRVSNSAAKRKINVFKQLSECYSKWDICQYNRAFNIINTLLTNQVIKQFNRLEFILKEQRAFLEQLKDESPLHRVLDWYYAVERRLDREEYSDMIWRCAHIDETLVVAKVLEVIKQKYNLDLTADNWGNGVKRNLAMKKELYPKTNEREIENWLSRSEAYRIISLLGIHYDNQTRQDANWLYKLRNEILHRGYYPNRTDAVKAHKAAEAIIKTVYNNQVFNVFVLTKDRIINIADEFIFNLLSQ